MSKKKKKTPVLTPSQQVFPYLDKLGKRLTLQQPSWKLYLSSFGLPFLILFLIWAFSGVVFGSRMILAHDQWHQYYPFYLDLLRKLKRGSSLLYSWTNAMGTNYLSMFAYYLASPMNFLGALLPEGLALGYYSFAVMVKISLAGLFFAVFMRHYFDRTDGSIAFFSLMYAFCAFICGYYWNAIWLDTVALLPLAALGTLRLLRDGNYVLYTAILALSILCSYYVGLFTCIFILLLFICYNICSWDDLGGFGSRLVRIAFFSALAIGMTAVLTLPAFLGLQATSSAVNKFPTGLALNITKDKSVLGIIDALRQIISQLGTGIVPTSMEGLPNVACGTATVILAIAYFCTKKIPLREKLCCAGLLLFFSASFIFRQLDYIWHGFHFPNMLPYRFSFLFSFVLLFMAYRAFLQLDRFRWYHCLYAAPFAVLFLFCVFSVQDIRPAILTAVLVLAVFAALYLFGKRILSKNLLVLLLCAVLLCEAAIGAIRGAQEVRFTDGSSYPRKSEAMQEILSEMNAREADTVDLWRAETTLTQTLNDNALNGYNGISTFSSAANCDVSQFLKGIGLPASVAGNRYVYEESTPLTNLLLGLKYMIDRDNLPVERPFFETVTSSGGVNLLENRTYLPMGFMVPSDAAEYDPDVRINNTRTENQNYIYQLLSGSRGNLISKYSLTSKKADENIDIGGSGSQFQLVKKEDASGGGKAHFTYRINETCHFCVYTSSTNTKDLYVDLNGTSLTSYSVKYGYLRDFGILHAGDELTFSIALKEDRSSGSLTIYAGTFDDNAFEALYEKLSAQCMTATSVTDTSIDGKITAHEDGICYFSIPYDSGWNVLVDGKKTSTVAVFGAFVGVRLTAGTHYLSLSYETPGFRTGLTVTYLCLAIFLVLTVIALLRRVFTRPLQQVEMEMIGSPAKKAPKEPLPDPEEPAFLEPIEDAPVFAEDADMTRQIPVVSEPDMQNEIDIDWKEW